jgi:hypothetical protein
VVVAAAAVVEEEEEVELDEGLVKEEKMEEKVDEPYAMERCSRR